MKKEFHFIAMHSTWEFGDHDYFDAFDLNKTT